MAKRNVQHHWVGVNPPLSFQFKCQIMKTKVITVPILLYVIVICFCYDGFAWRCQIRVVILCFFLWCCYSGWCFCGGNANIIRYFLLFDRNQSNQIQTAKLKILFFWLLLLLSVFNSPSVIASPQKSTLLFFPGCVFFVFVMPTADNGAMNFQLF